VPAPLLIRNVQLVTGDVDGTVLPGRSVATDAQGRITAVGPAAELADPAPGTRVIDGRGRYLVPGLINAHAHLFADGSVLPPFFTSPVGEKCTAAFAHSPLGRAVIARRTKRNVLTQMASGVTTIRSLGDTGDEVVAVRDAIERGAYLGPRVLASGPLLAVTGGHGAPMIALISDNPWDARRNVRLNLRRGVNAIKIAATGGVTDARALGEAGRPQMTEAEMTAICEEAHNAGVVVAAHAQSQAGILAALRAGVDTIEHGAAITEEMAALFLDNPRSLRGFSALVPTFMAALPLVTLDPAITRITPVVRANAELIYAQMVQGVRDARQYGIRIGMGTDSALTYVTHYNTWRELDYVSRYGGIGNARALHAATRSNAEILGIDDRTGAIEVGRFADLVLTDGDPVESLRVLAEPEAVVVRGHVITRPRVPKSEEIEARLDSI
jgi:imidazolonepropionase-like amidohydrolase